MEARDIFHSGWYANRMKQKLHLAQKSFKVWKCKMHESSILILIAHPNTIFILLLIRTFLMDSKEKCIDERKESKVQRVSDWFWRQKQ